MKNSSNFLHLLSFKQEETLRAITEGYEILTKSGRVNHTYEYDRLLHTKKLNK